MLYKRTVISLVILAAITPLLAIPEWLTQALLAVLSVSIITLVQVGEPKEVEPAPSSKTEADNRATRSDTQDTTASDSNSNSADNQQGHNQKNKEKNSSVDTSNDTSATHNQWRRRSSRDLESKD